AVVELGYYLEAYTAVRASVAAYPQSGGVRLSAYDPGDAGRLSGPGAASAVPEPDLATPEPHPLHGPAGHPAGRFERRTPQAAPAHPPPGRFQSGHLAYPHRCPC